MIFGNELDDFDVGDVELESAGGALVGANFSVDDDGGFLGEGADALEDFFGDRGFVGDTLDGAGPVAEDGEEEFAGLAEIVEPAAEGDGLAVVGADGGDGGEVGGGGSRGRRR
jgi:hypothetical protein